ncbi:MAG: hypothetical protein ACOC1L_01585, partial [Bacillota bacterium]
MKNRVYNFEIERLYIVVLSFLSVLLSAFFFIDTAYPAVLNPALGFAFGFIILFDSKAYLPVFLGSILGYIVIFVFGVRLPFIDGALISVAYVIIMFIQIQMARTLSIYFHLYNFLHTVTVKQVLLNIVLLLFISTLGAMVLAVFYLGIDSLADHYFMSVVYALFGNVFGMILFTIPTVWAYDERQAHPLTYHKETRVYMGITIVSYLLVTTLLISDDVLLSFETDFYFILLFYLIIAMIFSYRLIMLFTVSFLVIAGSYVAFRVDDASQFYFMITYVSFATFGTILSFVIKHIIFVKREQIRDIAKKNQTVDRLITDIYELLTFSSTFIETPSNRDYLSHIEKTLQIAMRLVHDAKSGYCYIEDEGNIKVVASPTYDSDTIPYLYDAHVLFTKTEDDVVIYEDIGAALQRQYGKNYGLLMDIAYPVKSRAMLKFNYKKHDTFVVVIDKFINQGPFTADQTGYLKQFVSLVNILFTRSYYQAHNLSLKDEIVLQF